MRAVAWTTCWAGLLLLFTSGSAEAATSGGTGGAVGVTRTDWPCKGCAVGVPSGLDQTKGVKLLVALHGDEGSAGPIFDSFAPEVKKTTDFILFAAQCPTDSTCTDGSWWRTGPPSNDWINLQVAEIEKQYNIDYDHEHLTGWSGGAVYISAILGYLYPDQYGSATLISGAIKPSVSSCPKCLMPLYFYEGDQDFEYQYGWSPGARDYYKGCGDSVTWDLRPGLDHQQTADYAITQIPVILDWFRAHPDACPSRRGATSPGDAGADAATDVSTDARADGDGGTPPDAQRDDADAEDAAADASVDSASPADGGASSGCSCRAVSSRGETETSWLAAAAAFFFLLRKRVQTRRRAA